MGVETKGGGRKRDLIRIMNNCKGSDPHLLHEFLVEGLQQEGLGHVPELSQQCDGLRANPRLQVVHRVAHATEAVVHQAQLQTQATPGAGDRAAMSQGSGRGKATGGQSTHSK